MPNEIVCPKCYNHGMAKSGFTDGKQRYLCKVCNFRTVNGIEDLSLLKENVRLAKQKQSAQDLNRIERKSFREHARVENAVEKYTKRLLEKRLRAGTPEEQAQTLENLSWNTVDLFMTPMIIMMNFPSGLL